MSSHYLERYATRKRYISANDWEAEDIVVVIPCYNEEHLIASLDSLERCEPTDSKIAVVVVINASEIAPKEIKQRNRETYEQALAWSKKDRRLACHFILENGLPKKHAGVGMARRIGMDEAVRMFEENDKDGIILCYDADSMCEPNLFLETERLFSNQKVPGCSIHFEHPLEGDFEDEVYAGIIGYELHLRYFINAQRYAGFPYAFQTIGSSMAVRSSVYQKVGGMNRRKAGEDFYFLHKVIPIPGFAELNTTRTIPSPRISDRVPFGTGKAVGDWVNGDQSNYETYNPRSFEDLKVLFAQFGKLYEGACQEIHQSLPESVRSFIPKEKFTLKIEEIRNYTCDEAAFKKRCFQWFDAFKLMKFVHHARDHFYPNVSVEEGVKWLGDKYDVDLPDNSRDMLKMIRTFDREQRLLHLCGQLSP